MNIRTTLDPQSQEPRVTCKGCMTEQRVRSASDGTPIVASSTDEGWGTHVHVGSSGDWVQKVEGTIGGDSFKETVARGNVSDEKRD